MKKLIYSMLTAASLFAASCSDSYDDTALSNRVGSLENRIASLEEQCRQMNSNISSIQTIVNASQGNDYITSVSPLTEGGVQVGYTINFAKSESITIYHGKDGKNGQNGTDGKDGKDGENGKDGTTPQIGVKYDSDGILYWTLNGSWLLDDKQQKIRVTGENGKDGENGTNGSDGATGPQGPAGKDGITPQLKIENGNWYVSTDNGQSWTNLGKATGENGAAGNNGVDGDSFFQSVDTKSSNEYVTFTLADGTEFNVPLYSALFIAFDEENLIAMHTNSTREIGYTITGATDNLKVEVLSSGNVRAKISSTSDATGILTITTGATIDEYDKVVILVSNGQNTIMSSISFEEAGLTIKSEATYDNVSYLGGYIDINIETNTEYTVSIPKEAQNWISVVSSRAMRSETITLIIEPNRTGTSRSATVSLVDIDNIIIGNIEISQIDTDNIPENMEFTFPDEKFRQYVLYNFDTDNDGKISEEEALNVTEITAQDMEISSLEGIQYFTNLEKLNCFKNQLTSLDVSQNTALTYLCCYDNQLTSLDVSQNTALTILDCFINQLTTLDVSQNTALTELRCNYNLQLTSLDVSQNTALISLNCSNLQLTSLDVSQNTALTILDCRFNQLTSLDVSHNTALTELNCGYNQLTSLDVSQNTALTELDCNINQLTSLDVSQNTALTILDCRFNQLTTLDVSQNTTLTRLWCFDNQLTTLDVSQNTALTELNCGYNQLTSLDVSKNTALIKLDCRDNQLTTLDVSETNLGESSTSNPLYCEMESLKTLYLKTGWEINGINNDRDPECIHENTNIEYK